MTARRPPPLHGAPRLTHGLGWLAVLRRRSDEQAALEAGYAAALASVEQTVLPALRDGLVSDLADATSLDDAADWFTDRYQLDMRKGGSLSITRVQQAADTLQSTLYAVRTASLPAWHPAVAWTIAPAQVAEFDAAWTWMTRIGTWQSSMQTFLLPERDVDPANVPGPISRLRDPSRSACVARADPH